LFAAAASASSSHNTTTSSTAPCNDLLESDLISSLRGFEYPKERGFEKLTERLEKCVVFGFHRSGPSFRHHASALRHVPSSEARFKSMKRLLHHIPHPRRSLLSLLSSSR
jgi:hypothetical protein